jgi:hypothetical protein
MSSTLARFVKRHIRHQDNVSDVIEHIEATKPVQTNGEDSDDNTKEAE